MSSLNVVWGKTSTGGTFGFAWSLLYWFDLTRYDYQGAVWLVSFSFACLVPIAASLVPTFGNRVRGTISLGAAIFILPVWIYAHSYALNRVSPDSFLSVLFLFWWIVFLLAGGLVLLGSRGEKDFLRR